LCISETRDRVLANESSIGVIGSAGAAPGAGWVGVIGSAGAAPGAGWVGVVGSPHPPKTRPTASVMISGIRNTFFIVCSSSLNDSGLTGAGFHHSQQKLRH